MEAAEMHPGVSPRVGVEAAYFEGPAAKGGTAVLLQPSLFTIPFTVHKLSSASRESKSG